VRGGPEGVATGAGGTGGGSLDGAGSTGAALVSGGGLCGAALAEAASRTAGGTSLGLAACGAIAGGAAQPVSPELGGAPPTIRAVAAIAYG